MHQAVSTEKDKAAVLRMCFCAGRVRSWGVNA